MKRVLLVTMIYLAVSISLSFLFLSVFLNRASEHLLRSAGYARATVEKSGLDTDGILLKNIDFGNGMKIAAAKISFRLKDLVNGKRNAITVAVDGGVVNTETPWGVLPLGGRGTLMPRGEGWQWNSEVAAETKFAKLSGHLTTDIEKDGGRKNHFELAEGRIVTPGFEARRMTGWVETDSSGALKGQVAAGAVQGQDAAFQDVNATLENGRILLTGADRSGKRIAVDVNPDGSVFCNGHPIAAGVRPEPAQIVQLAKTCLQQ